MTTIQEYLNEKYPTKEDKERVKEVFIPDHFLWAKKKELEDSKLKTS